MTEVAPRTSRQLKVARPIEATPAAVAVIDREGLVIAIVAGRAPARAFLREGRL